MILDQARELGLPLVYLHKPGRVPPSDVAELCLDVTADGTSLKVAPLLRAVSAAEPAEPTEPDPDDDSELVPLRFIGADGHGVVYAERADANGADTGRAVASALAASVLPTPGSPSRWQHVSDSAVASRIPLFTN